MLNCEKYYRRSFNLLNDLLILYKNGYCEYEVQRFIYSRNLEKLRNTKVFNDENLSFTFSSLIALLGINRENIEDTGRNTNYLKCIKFNDSQMDVILLEFYQKFLNFRNVNTGLDEWLSVVQNLDANNTNNGYLQKVRNALLHSHFEPLIDEDLTRV